MNQVAVLVELHGVRFRKSSYSDPKQDCVEVGRSATVFGVRDSKLVHSPVLAVDVERGQAFLDAVKGGQFD
jgi:uncharacterized protein DUF397